MSFGDLYANFAENIYSLKNKLSNKNCSFISLVLI